MYATEEVRLAAVPGDLLRMLFEQGHGDIVTIRLSDGTELQCISNILRSQSDFFENALDPGRFKESFTRVVELPNDPPEAAKAWIEFLYTQEYTVPTGLDAADEALFHLDIMRISDVYLDNDLLNWADTRLSELINLNWEEIIPVIPEITENVSPWWGMSSNQEIEECARENKERLLEDDVRDALHKEAPDFMKELTDWCQEQWWKESWPSAGRWLDRLGGEYSVGMVYRTLKCPQCGHVQEKAVGLLEKSHLYCKKPPCSFSEDSDKWLAANEMRLGRDALGEE